MNKDMFILGIKIGIIFIVGFITGILMIMYSKPIRYDLNNDGEINLTDMVILRNYILDNE